MAHEPLIRLHKAFQTQYILTDTDVVDTLVGWTIGNRERGIPIFLLLVGPPSSLKTKLASVFAEALPDASLVGDLSDKTLLSGFEKGEKGNQSLLLKLQARGIGLFVNKEFGSLYSMRWETRLKVLNQLRELFDGEISFARGSGAEIHWEGFVGFLGCSVPVIDKKQLVMGKLGDRFLMYRMKAENRGRASRMAIREGRAKKGRAGRQRIIEAIQAFFGADPIGSEAVALRTEEEDQVVWLAEKLAKGRGIVEWGPDEIEGVSVEEPMRLAQVLDVLVRGIAAGRGRESVWAADMALLEKIAHFTFPPGRLSVLEAVQRGNGWEETSLGEALGRSRNFVRTHTQELQALGLIKRDKDTKLWKGVPHWSPRSKTKVVPFPQADSDE